MKNPVILVILFVTFLKIKILILISPLLHPHVIYRNFKEVDAELK